MKNVLIILLGVIFAQNALAQSAEDTIVSEMSKIDSVEYRQINGEGNNLNNFRAGTPLEPFIRMAPVDYADRVSTPADRTINPREISNHFFQAFETENSKNASDFLWLWGQFVDHDLTLTDLNPEESMHIPVPKCDRYFDLSCAGTNQMVFHRSESVLVNGVREQFNRITSYLDGSNVYGSDDVRAEALRTMDGTGKMILGEDGFLPKNTFGLQNLPSDSPHFFVAGDIRANDHIGLMAIHNLFVREHNFWATELKKKNPLMSGEDVYQRARQIIIAEIQNITFNEFLPLLVGTYAPAVESTYDDSLTAAIFSEFSTAAFRMGHTFVSGDFYLENTEGQAFFVKLRDSFFNPTEYSRSGIDSIMLGFSKHVAQERDPMINEELQNFLMVFPVEGIFDLFSFNIQRGRDHGIPSFNGLREAAGFSRVSEFDEISEYSRFNDSMSLIYPSVEDVDPWLGLIAEKAAPSALLGETASKIIADQFQLLRDADRLWFTRSYDASLVDAFKSQTLSKIIVRNTKISADQISKNAFVVEK